MKNKIIQGYLIAVVLGNALAIWANYLGVPLHVSLPCYFVMGIVIGVVWR